METGLKMREPQVGSDLKMREGQVDPELEKPEKRAEAGLNIPEMLEKLYRLPSQDIKSYSPLTLAYIGDAVYELLVRSVLVQSGNTSVNKLNKTASRIECAPRQSAIIRAIKDDLTEKERKIYKRGRNAKSSTKAKNASTADYRRATGLEAVVGYLYLTGELRRAAELVKMGIERTV